MMVEIITYMENYYILKTNSGFYVKSRRENYIKGKHVTLEAATKACLQAERDLYIDACEEEECRRVGC